MSKILLLLPVLFSFSALAEFPAMNAFPEGSLSLIMYECYISTIDGDTQGPFYAAGVTPAESVQAIINNNSLTWYRQNPKEPQKSIFVSIASMKQVQMKSIDCKPFQKAL